MLPIMSPPLLCKQRSQLKYVDDAADGKQGIIKKRQGHRTPFVSVLFLEFGYFYRVCVRVLINLRRGTDRHNGAISHVVVSKVLHTLQ